MRILNPTPHTITTTAPHSLQIDAIDVLPPSRGNSGGGGGAPLIALASSRLEGSTWDGAITLLHAQRRGGGEGTGTGVTLTRAGAIRPLKYGIPALAWCGGNGNGNAHRMLAAAQDNGDVEVSGSGVG